MKKHTFIQWVLVFAIALGMMIALMGPPISFAKPSQAAVGSILINEFIATPTSDEAVELCNPTDSDIDVGGWVLDWDYGSTQLHDGLVVPAHGYLVIDDSNTVDGISISNGGTILSIKDDANNVIDSVAYGDAGAAPKPEYKFSTARVPDCTDTDDDAADFNTDESPTMGAANDGPASALGSTTITINEVDATAGAAFIELYNSGTSDVDLSGWRISVDDSYDIPAGTTIPAGGFWVLEEAAFPQYFNLDADGDNVYLFNDQLERVDQIGWDQAANSSWNRLPDGAGANDGWQQDQIPLYAIAPSPNASNQTNLTRMYIHEIQGAQHLSPYEGQHVENVYGIVTVIDRRGFWMQTPDSDMDADDATSEGVYVYVGSTPTVTKGDEVLVSADVTEYYPGGYDTGNLSITELSNPSIIVLSQGNPLPSPVILGEGGRMPPNTIIEDDATGDVNSTGIFDPDEDGIDFYESVEGMLVQINDAVAVGPTSKYGEIPVVGDNGAHAGLRTYRGGLALRPDDPNPERIIIDDALYGNEPQVVPGDRFEDPIVGVMHYSYGNFKVLNPDPLPAVAPSGLGREYTNPTYGQLSIATFNLENLDPGDAADKFNGLATIIVQHMRSPDIIGVEEVQDNNGPTDDGTVDADVTFQMLIDAIQAAGGPTYEFRQINPENNADGGQPGANIRVGFLFRPDRVTFVDRPGGDATTPTDVQWTPNGPALTLSPGRVAPDDPAFNEDPDLGYEATRKSLAGEFIFQGYKVFVIVNHFKSKRGDDPLFGRVQPPEQVTLAQRKAQAQAINAFVAKILDLDPQANIVVLGDLNDFDFSDALGVLQGDELINLVNYLPREDRYSFIFDGNSQLLDHLLVSTNMHGHYTRIDAVHVNAEFPATDRPSDHDPVLATFDLPVWRFDGFVYQGISGDESTPLAGVTLRLYGRNAGESAPGSWYKDATTDAGGYFNFHIIEPWDFDEFTLMAMAPQGMVPIGAWSEDGTVIAPDTIRWTNPAPGAHHNKFWVAVPTPTPTPSPTPTPTRIWLPVFLNP